MGKGKPRHGLPTSMGMSQAEVWDALMHNSVSVVPNSHPTGRPAILIRDRESWGNLVRAVGQKKAEAMALRRLRAVG